jgi:type IV pilus assembly protein PilM
LLPAEISKEQQFNSKRVFIVGAAVVAVLALIPPLLYQVQAETVYKDQREQIERRLQPLRAFEAKIQDEQQVAEQIRGSISQIEGLVNSKSNWINFFSDLQERLVALEDVWLETLTVDRSAPTVDVSANGEQAEVTRGTAYRLRLSGRLLLRDFDPNNPGALDPRQASARVNALLERFTESEFIEAVESVQFDTSDRRILRFNFTLVVDQDKPL